MSNDSTDWGSLLQRPMTRRDTLRLAGAGVIGGTISPTFSRAAEPPTVGVTRPEAAVDLAYQTVARAAELIRTKQLTSLELTQACLDRIDRYAKPTFAFITITRDLALSQARVADAEIARGNYRGVWHGIPIVLKDLIGTKGILTTAGTGALEDWVPSEDATVWAKLKAAGAVLLGKTNLHELAAGFSNVNPFYGTTRNPWSPGLNHITGGSSGGNGVAIASGMALAGVGSDTGGSIRVPSAMCGVTGLKPTHGRVSTFNCIYLSWTLDHLGPMARSVEDAALMMNVIAGFDPKDPISAAEPTEDYTADLAKGMRGLKLAMPMGATFWGYAQLQPEIAATVRKAIDVLKGLGASISEVIVPGLEQALAGSIFNIEQAYHLQDLLKVRPEKFSPGILASRTTALQATAVDYMRSLRNIAETRTLLEDGLANYDAYVLPTVPIFPSVIDPASTTGIGQFTSPINRSGQPALTVPAGFGSNGFPIGMMIVARRFNEKMVLRIGHAYQQATDWHTRRPPLAA